jgi:predicted protein tyrosine phosphatase
VATARPFDMKKILFICGRNLQRSPTAEKIFQNIPGWKVRSAGTSESSRRKIQEADLLWADHVMVMEQKHASRIRSRFSNLDWLPPIDVLDIPDDFDYMDPELIELLEICVSEFTKKNKDRCS